MRSSLIFFSRLDKIGYPCSFGNEMFHLMFESCVVRNGILSDCLYRLNMNEHVSFFTEFDKRFVTL